MTPSPEHILERSLIHFFASGGLLLAFIYSWSYAKQRAKNLELYETIILPALLILWTTAMREAYDVYNNGSLVKSIFDLISWFIGVSVWGVVIWKLRRRL